MNHSLTSPKMMLLITFVQYRPNDYLTSQLFAHIFTGPQFPPRLIKMNGFDLLWKLKMIMENETKMKNYYGK